MVFQVLPEAFDGMQLRAVSRQPHQAYIVGHGHAVGARRWRLVEEHAVGTFRLMVAKLVQEDGTAVGIEARHLPPAGIAGGGFDRRIQPVRLVEGLDALHGLHPVAREAAMDGQREAQTAVVLAENPHGLLGRLPP